MDLVVDAKLLRYSIEGARGHGRPEVSVERAREAGDDDVYLPALFSQSVNRVARTAR